MHTHNLGFPRIGPRRELKWILEAYWRGEIDRQELEHKGTELRRANWQSQLDRGLDQVPVGDFCWYDHVLETSCMLGCVPERFDHAGGEVDLDTLFWMARGQAPGREPRAACELTKWFDTNYHYLVPELRRDLRPTLSSGRLFAQYHEARELMGGKARPVLLGPLSWLWLGKVRGETFDRLDLLDGVLEVYREVLERLSGLGAQWVQIDEPILCLDLPADWKAAFDRCYRSLSESAPKLLLTTYYGGLGDNLDQVCNLPVDGLHLDSVRAPEELAVADRILPSDKVLSAGIIDGRNVWRSDLEQVLALLRPLTGRRGERIWIAPSCSLMHLPYTLAPETGLDPEIRGWLTFAMEKLEELALISRLLEGASGPEASLLAENRKLLAARRLSPRVRRKAVQERMAGLDELPRHRSNPYATRRELQHQDLELPLFPTTTIGSFPQTEEIRRARRDYRAGRLTGPQYRRFIREQVADTIARQERLGLDVLVHGEAERNDMVEFFGEQLEGLAITFNGWVQSYGSRCVKPPIIYGDVSRPAPMTVELARYAQSLTGRPVKGMLTGPVTILQWSFVRDDQPRAETCRQLALAIRDEVADLEQAGIGIIQIDEPALREGLPLRKAQWKAYLEWTVECFHLAADVVRDQTQIHTHMCYAEFEDIFDAIVALDADVITIETSRSQMDLLRLFEEKGYPNEIGPGVYDIHSPNIPPAEAILALLERAVALIPAERLWVNPDCGLKTRRWPEVEQALANMVSAAREMRRRHGPRKRLAS